MKKCYSKNKKNVSFFPKKKNVENKNGIGGYVKYMLYITFNPLNSLNIDVSLMKWIEMIGNEREIQLK